MTYTNWESGEPNNWDNEDCINMSAANGEWNDIKCSDLRPFVCEIETRKFISTDQYNIDALEPSYAIFNQLCVLRGCLH